MTGSDFKAAKLATTRCLAMKQNRAAGKVWRLKYEHVDTIFMVWQFDLKAALTKYGKTICGGSEV
jgi:hypothetical protein